MPGRSSITVVDEFTREGPMIYVSRSLTPGDVIDCLSYLFELYGRPECIKSDNAPEFVAKRVQAGLRNNMSIYVISTLEALLKWSV